MGSTWGRRLSEKILRDGLSGDFASCALGALYLGGKVPGPFCGLCSTQRPFGAELVLWMLGCYLWTQRLETSTCVSICDSCGVWSLRL